MALAAVAPDPALRATLLDAARAPVARALGKPVRFKVERLAREGEWAFLLAEMQDEHGHPIALAGTSLADAAANGAASRAAAVLLRRQGGTWQAVETAVGPTDVAWAGWAARHKAPAALFAP